MESSVAITDKMQYKVKASAVRSENYLHNIKASNGSAFTVGMGTDIIFEVPALGNGYYCDFSTSYFRMRVDCTLPVALTPAAGQTHTNANGYVRFERGPESMFRRVVIQDASGNLLENFENYNDLYCLTELLTNNKSNREGPGCFHGEGLQLPGGNPPYVATNAAAYAQDTQLTSVSTNPLHALIQPNGKFECKKFADLGSAVVANFSMVSSVNNANPTENKWGAYNLLNPNYGTYGYSQNRSGGKYYTFQLLSSLFGGSADKYLPMSAINGLRITLSCDNVSGGFVQCGLNSGVNGDVANICTTVTINDPTFFLNMVRVDPTVDQQLLEAARSTEDGNIRIHSQTYSSYQMSMAAGNATFEYIIPVKVSSLKAIYFTFAPSSYGSIENFDRSDGYTCLAGRYRTADPGDQRVMKTSWFWNNLNSYQFFIDGKPTPASPVQVRLGHSENLAELSRALHFGHKSGDGQYLSLLQDVGNYTDQNFILGQEFESFSQKSRVIESGMNTLTSLITLRLYFNSGTAYYGVNTTGSAEACYLKVFALYDTFLTITPGTGIMRTET